MIIPSHPNIACYKRYIDDVCGVWVPSPDANTKTTNWLSFKSDMQTYHGVEWTFHPLSPSVDFLDITIIIRDGIISITLYEKVLNLYLYISPHSYHPPGVLTELVLGNYHRIYTLFTDQSNVKYHLRNFYCRLFRRGYNSNTLLPFLKELEI